jgi:hypothetical protein
MQNDVFHSKASSSFKHAHIMGTLRYGSPILQHMPQQLQGWSTC